MRERRKDVIRIAKKETDNTYVDKAYMTKVKGNGTKNDN